MIILFYILLIIQCIGIGVLLTWNNDLHRKILKLEYKIECTQYQLDDILCDINGVKNMISTYESPKENKG